MLLPTSSPPLLIPPSKSLQNDFNTLYFRSFLSPKKILQKGKKNTTARHSSTYRGRFSRRGPGDNLIIGQSPARASPRSGGQINVRRIAGSLRAADVPLARPEPSHSGRFAFNCALPLSSGLLDGPLKHY